MKALQQGLKKFHTERFLQLRERFQKLSSGQQPPTLFITCSDSRIDPGLLTHSQPGELFVIRNAGNLVPPHSASPSGESATIEYAVAVLKVQDVVVCGHSDCGAMKALMAGEEALRELPQVNRWLALAENTKAVVQATGPHEDPVRRAIEQNVLQQLDNLMTHPSVASAVHTGTLRLHGWVYDIPTGHVLHCADGRREFVTLAAPEMAVMG